MFFEGTLQEGIASAIGQSKLVVCFVADDQAESKQWEEEFLRDETLTELLQAKAVALRLVATSQEAGYLAAIVPLPKTPTLVVIKNGELKEYIAAGVSKNDFVARACAALAGGGETVTRVTPPAASDTTAPQTSVPQTTTVPTTVPEPTRPADAPAAEESSGEATPSSSTEEQPTDAGMTPADRAVAQTLAERAARLTAQRKEAEEARKRQIAKNKAKAVEAAKAGLPPSETKKHADLLRQRKKDELEHRRRIQKLIDDDKAARRAAQAERQAEREAQREAERIAAMGLPGDEGEEGPAGQTAAPSSTLLSYSSRTSDFCAVQVRLFDGSSLRSRFPAKSSLRADVRQWVDANRQDGTEPYTFKLVLTPLPPRPIDVTEESQSLAALGLCPSATLVLVAVDRYSVAYAEATSGPVARFVAYITVFFAWLYGLVAAFFATFFGRGPRPEPQPAPAPQEEPQQGAQARKTRVQGFRNPDERRSDHQLYNGNSLNFEPRKDDDDDE